MVEWKKTFPLTKELAEDIVWTNDISRAIGKMPENVTDIWFYGFSEMFNNAIDHSSASNITVHIKKTAATTEMAIYDDGVGIFKKIQNALSLLDERHAVFELVWVPEILASQFRKFWHGLDLPARLLPG